MKRFGWKPDRAHAQAFVGSLPYGVLDEDVPRLMRQREKRDVYLWQPLRKVAPDWQRVSQEIGDCVSHGASIACSLLLAQLAADGLTSWQAEAASEAIYGGCRVEIHGRPAMGYWEDGAAGSWGAQWLNEYGVLLWIDYSQQTGNPEHNLSRYSGKRAQEWGYYGCGGRSDKGSLDAVARQYPVKDVSQIRTVEAAEAALAAGCPITIASQVGFEGQRDSEGIIRRRGTWPHQMALWGLRYRANGEPLFRVVNSWGKSASGPDPDIDWPAVSDCSWWIVAEDLAAILRDEDSFAFSKVQGFELPPFDYSDYV
jgi:hypothetical protein